VGRHVGGACVQLLELLGMRSRSGVGLTCAPRQACGSRQPGSVHLTCMHRLARAPDSTWHTPTRAAMASADEMAADTASASWLLLGASLLRAWPRAVATLLVVTDSSGTLNSLLTVLYMLRATPAPASCVAPARQRGAVLRLGGIAWRERAEAWQRGMPLPGRSACPGCGVGTCRPWRMPRVLSPCPPALAPFTTDLVSRRRRCRRGLLWGRPPA
jgi:hypothetical protein